MEKATIVKFNENDTKVMKSYLMSESKTVLKTIGAVFIFYAYFVSMKSKYSIESRLFYLFGLFTPLMILFFIFYQKKIIADLIKNEKIVSTATVNIVSIFGEKSLATIQIIFPNNKFINFNLDYSEAVKYDSGDSIIVEYAKFSKKLLSISLAS